MVIQFKFNLTEPKTANRFNKGFVLNSIQAANRASLRQKTGFPFLVGSTSAMCFLSDINRETQEWPFIRNSMMSDLDFHLHLHEDPDPFREEISSKLKKILTNSVINNLAKRTIGLFFRDESQRLKAANKLKSLAQSSDEKGGSSLKALFELFPIAFTLLNERRQAGGFAKEFLKEVQEVSSDYYLASIRLRWLFNRHLMYKVEIRGSQELSDIDFNLHFANRSLTALGTDNLNGLMLSIDQNKQPCFSYRGRRLPDRTSEEHFYIQPQKNDPAWQEKPQIGLLRLARLFQVTGWSYESAFDNETQDWLRDELIPKVANHDWPSINGAAIHLEATEKLLRLLVNGNLNTLNFLQKIRVLSWVFPHLENEDKLLIICQKEISVDEKLNLIIDYILQSSSDEKIQHQIVSLLLKATKSLFKTAKLQADDFCELPAWNDYFDKQVVKKY